MDHSLYSIGNIDFLDLFLVICIILHIIPQLLAQHPRGSVSPEFHRVLTVFDFMVANSCQQNSDTSSVILLMYNKNNNGPRIPPWRTPDKTEAQPDFTPFTTNVIEPHLRLKRSQPQVGLRLSHTPIKLGSLSLTLKASISTAADNIHKYVFIVFQRN